MNALKNKVQLIGNVGNAPEIKLFDGGKKVAKLTLATNESFKNEKGEKITDTQWHQLVAWGKNAVIIENFITKGKEIAVEGKLTYNHYTDKNGDKRYSTEIVVSDILLMSK